MKIEIKNIAKSYKKKKVLKNISFTATSGQCIGVLGANGCGKSTLLSILAGVQRADRGAFLYDGHDLMKHSFQRSELIGYVPQGTPLIDELTAYDNLLLWYDKKQMQKELDNGILNSSVSLEEIRKYIWYMETKGQWLGTAEGYHLGENNGISYYFYYEKSEVTTLDKRFLSTIKTRADEYVIYADKCALSAQQLMDYRITFKKIPRDIARL